MGTGFSDQDNYPVSKRGTTYAMGYFSAKRLGAGQYYLMSISDNGGNQLDGKNIYRLTVPPNAPVQQYWSATAYDRETHALIREMSRNSRASSIPELQKNADGSVDVYFAAKAPAGKDTNLVPTDPSRQFEVLFRFYGPEKPLFEKTWVLPDIEKIS